MNKHSVVDFHILHAGDTVPQRIFFHFISKFMMYDSSANIFHEPWSVCDWVDIAEYTFSINQENFLSVILCFMW